MTKIQQTDQKKFNAEVLEKNQNVSSAVVQQQADLERKLRALGVDVKPEFRLSPRLGDELRITFNKPQSKNAT